MKNYKEKCKNIYWVKPAISHRQHCYGLGKVVQWLQSLKKRVAQAAPTCTLLLLLSSFILLSLFLVLACWLDLSMYSGKSILFLKRRLEAHDFPLDCSACNETQTCPKNYPTTSNPRKDHDRSSSQNCPDYFHWIHEDLRHWRESGITRDMVDRANKSAHFRLVILDGKAYVEKFRKSLQTRDLFTRWGFVQLLRQYPGQVPDSELMFDCDDHPVINAKLYFQTPSPRPPPLFRYCSGGWSLDIVFPDWSLWGWSETNQKPWDIAMRALKEGKREHDGRVGYHMLYWRGNPRVSPGRGDLVKCNVNESALVDWNTRLFVQGYLSL